MKKFLSVLLCLALTLGSLTAFAQTYTGEAEGMHGPVKVEFEVTDGKITKVTVVSHDEHTDYGVPAVDQLPAKIVEKGDTGVDVIAGSTFTSKAILKAIDDALAAAAPAAEPAAAEAPVVYTGEAEGMHGPVKVE
ncbi:MAG: FMN-binding protein, partial [Clostridiales bacterium]|nr:FMN-binding protein [Clostridiales bacterium]